MIKVSDITIEGRKYVPIKNGTFAHDIWITKKVREAGLSNIHIDEGETQDDFIDRLAVAAWESGVVLEILGGLLMPAEIEAKNWTPDLAKKTSEFFGNVTDDESKKKLRMQVGGVLFYFFVSALSSSKTSTKSGTQTEAVEGGRHVIEDASITATSDTSSAR